MAELEKLLEELQYTVGVDNSAANLYDSVVLGCTVYAALVTQFTPLQIKGFTSMMIANENLKKTIREIQLLYMDS